MFRSLLYYLWPFVTIRRHVEAMNELDAVIQDQGDLIDKQTSQVADLLNLIGVIRAKIALADQADIDVAIARMETDGVIWPEIWSHHG